jgi:hypothetical protein
VAQQSDFDANGARLRGTDFVKGFERIGQVCLNIQAQATDNTLFQALVSLACAGLFGQLRDGRCREFFDDAHEQAFGLVVS